MSLLDNEPVNLYRSCPVVSELKETRVLSLLPGLDDNEIRCTLSKIALNGRDARQRQSYEALSYTWGSGECVPILVNAKTVFITANLSAAMRRLRSQHKPRSLWIDALCINQMDFTERSGQVKLMGDIFGNAIGVIVWLGDVRGVNWILPDEDHVIYETAQGESRSYRSPESRPLGSLDLSLTELQRCALHSVLHGTRPRWWERTWIVQEFCMAPANLQICYAEFEEDYDDFFSAHGLLWQLVAYNGRDLVCQSFWSAQYRLKDIRSKVRQGPLTILDFAENCFQAAATDARDKAFSLRSMVSVDEASWIEPDYCASTLSVFARATFASIYGSGHLGILRYAWSTASRDPLLPSWAVDFGDGGLLPTEFMRTQIRGRALFEELEPWVDADSFPASSTPLFDEAMGSLMLAGRPSGSVQEVALFESCDLVPEVATTVSGTQTRLVTSLIRKIAVRDNPRGWSALLTDASKHRSRAMIRYLADVFNGWYQARYLSAMNGEADRLLSDYALFSATREPADISFFTTSEGLIGLIRAKLRPGDFVVLLRGAQLPIILRSSSRGDGEFCFLGFAVVVGLMGESPRQSPLTAADFYFTIR